jgi:hypothetical protein
MTICIFERKKKDGHHTKWRKLVREKEIGKREEIDGMMDNRKRSIMFLFVLDEVE